MTSERKVLWHASDELQAIVDILKRIEDASNELDDISFEGSLKMFFGDTQMGTIERVDPEDGTVWGYRPVVMKGADNGT